MSRIWQDGLDYVAVSENIFIREKENRIEFYLNEKNLGTSMKDKMEMLDALQKKVVNNSDNKAMIDIGFIPCGMLILQTTPFLKKEKRRKIVNMIIDDLTKKKEEVKNGEKEEEKEEIEEEKKKEIKKRVKKKEKRKVKKERKKSV